MVGAAPVDDAIGEPQSDLLLRALHGVAPVDDVPAHLNAVVPADRPWLRRCRVRGADDLAARRHHALALPHHRHHGAGADVLHQRREEGLARQVGVVLLSERVLHLHHLHGLQEEPLLLEPADDVANEPALHAVGLDHDEGELGVGHGDGRRWRDAQQTREGVRAARWRDSATMQGF